jgi:predicted transcriptional regulator
MNTLRIGIASQDEIRQRTIDIVSGRLIAKSTNPKVWFTSVESLAQIVGRAQSNLTRTLRRLENYGIVELRKEGRNMVPCVVYDEIELHVPLAA